MKRLFLVSAVLVAIAAGIARAGSNTGTVTGRVLVSPLSVEVFVPPDPVKAGKSFRIRAEVVNAGTTRLQNVAVTLLANPSLVLYDPVTQVLDKVGPGRDKRVRWDACSTSAGGYVVMARATASPFTAESTGQLVQIAAAKKPAC